MAKGRHRAEPYWTPWRWQVRFMKNRYYHFFLPKMKKRVAEFKVRLIALKGKIVSAIFDR